MSEQRPPEEPQAVRDESDTPAWATDLDQRLNDALSKADIMVWLGRLLGLLVVVVALIVAIKAADDARDSEFWVFLSTIVGPMAIGFLIIVASEILNRLGQR
ncbi:MAG: hypothetical protein ACE5Q6_25555 [Dehalococcoidia bacterium]